MAHKVCIDGTAYEIDGGKAMVDGTVYEIDKGKTLVDGTAYEVGFDDGMRTVTVTHDSYDAQYWWSGCSATLSDGSYVSLNSAGTYELPIGTVITCEGGVSFSQSRSARMRIYLNEEIVAETYRGNTYGDGAVNYISYEYTLSQNITLDPRNDKAFTYDDPAKFGAIYITEE